MGVNRTHTWQLSPAASAWPEQSSSAIGKLPVTSTADTVVAERA